MLEPAKENPVDVEGTLEILSEIYGSIVDSRLKRVKPNRAEKEAIEGNDGLVGEDELLRALE